MRRCRRLCQGAVSRMPRFLVRHQPRPSSMKLEPGMSTPLSVAATSTPSRPVTRRDLHQAWPTVERAGARGSPARWCEGWTCQSVNRGFWRWRGRPEQSVPRVPRSAPWDEWLTQSPGKKSDWEGHFAESLKHSPAGRRARAWCTHWHPRVSRVPQNPRSAERTLLRRVMAQSSYFAFTSQRGRPRVEAASSRWPRGAVHPQNHDASFRRSRPYCLSEGGIPRNDVTMWRSTEALRKSRRS